MNEKRVQKNICTNDGGIILKTKEKVRKYQKTKDVSFRYQYTNEPWKYKR